ncbi:unnamed protein product [Choristocarpus tenellus]
MDVMEAPDTGEAGPNVLITGTPGTGKTSTCQAIAERTGLRHINVGDVVRAEQCHDGYNKEFDTYMLNESKLVEALEDRIQEGGNVFDFHSCEFFPDSWFDMVVVLRAETSVLYDRLVARGYAENKVSENVECEIMQVVLEEARDTFQMDILHEVESNNVEDLEANVEKVARWLEVWRGGTSTS